LGESGSALHLHLLDPKFLRATREKAKRTVRKLMASELSARMRSLIEKCWAKYRARIERGDITAEDFVYRPRGPMRPKIEAKQDQTHSKNQIATAHLVHLAFEGRSCLHGG
jgi:hypothetical protein